MTLLASLAIVLPMTVLPASHGMRSAAPPHPAVVRISAPENGGIAHGSGALVAVQGEHGLVVTNWHVVRDATGQIMVEFADGFRSGARVMATDEDWDLAALAIWRPAAEPIPLAPRAARPGEPLTIAGYGSGSYRAITGRCTQYVAPGSNHPFEMVELSAGARQGDSGGPILNSRGELAGVLFGSADGCTTGSYSGRVRWFLAQVSDQFRGFSVPSTLIAGHPAPRPSSPPAEPRPVPPPAFYERWEPDETPPAEPLTQPEPVTVSIGSPYAAADTAAARPNEEPSVEGWDAAVAGPNPQAEPPDVGEASTLLEQIKTFLAVTGLVALLFHGLRLINRVQEV